MLNPALLPRQLRFRAARGAGMVRSALPHAGGNPRKHQGTGLSQHEPDGTGTASGRRRLDADTKRRHH